MTTTNTTTTTTDNTPTTTPASPGQLALSAVVASLNAQRETALAQISLFINNPAGVADHNNFVEEIQECVAQLTNATNALETIRTTFSFGTVTPTTPANTTSNTANRS